MRPKVLHRCHGRLTDASLSHYCMSAILHCNLQGLKELKELISSYQSMRDSGRAVAICQTIIETARQCNLDKVRFSLMSAVIKTSCSNAHACKHLPLVWVRSAPSRDG